MHSPWLIGDLFSITNCVLYQKELYAIASDSALGAMNVSFSLSYTPLLSSEFPWLKDMKEIGIQVSRSVVLVHCRENYIHEVNYQDSWYINLKVGFCSLLHRFFESKITVDRQKLYCFQYSATSSLQPSFECNMRPIKNVNIIFLGINIWAAM